MNTKLRHKKIFNQDSAEPFEQARVLGGTPNGIFNFNKTNHKWATELYKKMEARTWFPSQVNITKDTNNYNNLTKAEKRAYDLFLAQLIANDSLQTNQIMDKINSYITSPIVNACLARQSAEEATHSYSYSVMAEDIANNTDHIYFMHLQDEELSIKNKAVEKMYAAIYKEYVPSLELVMDIVNPAVANIVLNRDEYTNEELTKEITTLVSSVINTINTNLNAVNMYDVLLGIIANQILEELVFPGGFAGLLSLGNKMPGSAEMISEINFSSLPIEKSVA